MRACEVDHSVELSIEYLEQIERQRAKRIKALEKRGVPNIKQYTDLSEPSIRRYKYGLTGIRFWVYPRFRNYFDGKTVWNEMSRVPYNPYNTLALIAVLYPQDSMSQAQTQAEETEDDARRRDLTSLANHLAKRYNVVSDEERLYVLGLGFRLIVGNLMCRNILFC